MPCGHISSARMQQYAVRLEAIRTDKNSHKIDEVIRQLKAGSLGEAQFVAILEKGEKRVTAAAKKPKSSGMPFGGVAVNQMGAWGNHPIRFCEKQTI